MKEKTNKTRSNNNKRGKDVEEKFDKCDDKKRYSKKNDVSWYVSDPQILNDVARIPYSIPVGYPMSRRGKAETGIIPAGYDDAIPGIAAMGIVPTIGNAQYANDAVNVAANGMYTFVRHLNSGSRNYDANDLIIYCMAVNSVYYMISWATRLYATLSLYAQGNRYLPDALLKAQGIDVDDLRSNMAQFRAGINQRIRKISTLLVPGVLPIFARHSWLFSNYFIEGESIKDQIYLFHPSAWYKFALDDDGAGMLKCFALVGTGANGIVCQDIFDILDEMIAPIFADEDFNIISGDILKAYGEGNVLKLGLIPDELPISLAWEEEVLLQFKNAKPCRLRTKTMGTGDVMNSKWYDDMFDIVQDNNKQFIEVLRSVAAATRVYDFSGSVTSVSNSNTEQEQMLMQAFWNEHSKQIMLTSPHSDVQPAENMVNTRLTLAFNIEYDSDPGDDNPVNVFINDMYFGSEWPTQVVYWCYHRDKSTGVNDLFNRKFGRVLVITPSNSTSVDACVHSYLPIRSSFKYAPELAILEDQTYTDEEDVTHVQIIEAGRSLFEVDNYTLVDAEVIGLLHNAAIQGEYNIPRVALFATK